MEPRHVVITGASSGIGAAIAARRAAGLTQVASQCRGTLPLPATIAAKYFQDVEAFEREGMR